MWFFKKPKPEPKPEPKPDYFKAGEEEFKRRNGGLDYYQVKCKEMIFIKALKERLPSIKEQLEKDIAVAQKALDEAKPKCKEIEKLVYSVETRFHIPGIVGRQHQGYIENVLHDLARRVELNYRDRVYSILEECFESKNILHHQLANLLKEHDIDLCTEYERGVDLIKKFRDQLYYAPKEGNGFEEV